MHSTCTGIRIFCIYIFIAGKCRYLIGSTMNQKKKNNLFSNPMDWLWTGACEPVMPLLYVGV